jgi:hypothetical protein
MSSGDIVDPRQRGSNPMACDAAAYRVAREANTRPGPYGAWSQKSNASNKSPMAGPFTGT